VPRLPTAVLVCALMILAFLSLACGLILDSVALGRRELKRLHYLHLPAPPHPAAVQAQSRPRAPEKPETSPPVSWAG
jgi:hypothetical protein